MHVAWILRIPLQKGSEGKGTLKVADGGRGGTTLRLSLPFPRPLHTTLQRATTKFPKSQRNKSPAFHFFQMQKSFLAFYLFLATFVSAEPYHQHFRIRGSADIAIIIVR